MVAKQGEVDTAKEAWDNAQAALDNLPARGVTVDGESTVEVISLGAAQLAILGEGDVTVTADATDVAGNVSPTANASFTLDTITPDAPSIDSWATDTNITDDGVTSDNTLTLTVSGEPGGTPTLYVDGEAFGPGFTWTEDSEGVYTVATDELEHEFAGDLTVTVTDTAGNESAHSNAATVAVDTIAPAKPVIDSVVEDTNVTDDGVTFDNTLTLTVTGESGAALTLLQDLSLIHI